MKSTVKPNEISLLRIYDAPVEKVWEAWVDPKQVKQWWGPRGFTLTTVSKDVRVGGTWIYTMHGPDGTDYPNMTTYYEVEKHAKLVYDHGANEHQQPLFRVTALFSEVDGKTHMDMTMATQSAEAAQQIKQFIRQASGDSTWDRLAEYLSSEDCFVINRSFEVPIKKLFTLWTDPNHIAKWLAPTGFSMKFIKPDLYAGGTTFYSMSNDQGLTMYGKANYLEIVQPSRIVYTQIFCDKDENVSRHPMAPTWPETMHTTIRFYEEGDNQTRISIVWKVHGNATAQEREAFHSAKTGMTQGWSGSFEKLEQYLRAQ